MYSLPCFIHLPQAYFRPLAVLLWLGRRQAGYQAIYRQRFARGQLAFAYDLASIAACWTDYDRLMFHWHARHPGRIHELAYERLVAEPEASVRALLQDCGLPFEPACLRAHAAQRTVRTASAAQVREPLRGDTARAPLYGALLDPLRRLLGE